MNNYSGNLFESPYGVNEEYLAHFGVKGMKWGIRRYQNRDGSYTSLGKRRRRNDVSESSFSEDYKAAHTGKDPRTMTNAELKKTNERLSLERNYKQNMMPVTSQPQYTEGQKLAQTILKSTVTATVSAVVGATLVTKGREVGTQIMNESATKKLIIGGIAAAGVGATAAYAYHQPKQQNN